MSKIFTTDLDKSKQNKNIKVHEFYYSKSCNKTSMSLPKSPTSLQPLTLAKHSL